MKDTIIIGTRGSILALKQTQDIVKKLQLLYPQHRFVLQQIKTRGDRASNTPLSRLGGKGVFVKELESALLSGEIDLAVHSCKDLPTQLMSGLDIAVISQREDARDALVSNRQLTLAQLPPQSCLGTGSQRRTAQIKAARPDIEITDLRGNIDTRLRKIESGKVDASILAAAGLIRLGWQRWITEYLSPEICLPAVGQGALAIEIRADDRDIRDIVTPLDHRESRQAVVAERALLQGLGGGCHNPIASLALVNNSFLEMDGLVATTDGEKILRSHIAGKASEAEQLGQFLAEKLMTMGAAEILCQD